MKDTPKDILKVQIENPKQKKGKKHLKDDDNQELWIEMIQKTFNTFNTFDLDDTCHKGIHCGKSGLSCQNPDCPHT
jgi:hypothetical protein